MEKLITLIMTLVLIAFVVVTVDALSMDTKGNVKAILVMK